MQWDRPHAIGLSRPRCKRCHGDGLRTIHEGLEVPCACIFRAIFRICYRRFRECVALADHTGSVSLECTRGKESRRAYSRKSEEFSADFCLISRRVLSDFEHRIFRYHFLLGADWRLCCRSMRIDRAEFFYLLYRIERKLGRAFAETQPYPLFPLDEYFGGTIPSETITCESMAA